MTEYVFWGGVVGCVAMLAVILLWPRRRARADVDRTAANVALYEQRRGELALELREGRLSDAEHALLLSELGAGLLRDAAPVASGLDVQGAANASTSLAPAGSAVSAPAVGVRSRLAIGLLIALPLAALAGYFQMGRLADVDLAGVAAQLEAAEAAPAGTHAPAELLAMADKLERRLADNPSDADGWFLLGRTAINLNDPVRAAGAFARVSELVPNEPAPVIYQAQAEFLAADRKVTAKVRAVVDRALALVPDHPVMMEMLAVDAFATGDFRATLDYLTRGLPGVTDPQQRAYFQEGIARAAAQLGVPVPDSAVTAPALAGAAPGAGMGAGPGAASESAGGAARFIDVDVRLQPGLSLPPEAVVFVTARAIGGPPMPVAVQRRTVADLPFTARLDQGSAMNPELSMATVDRVAVSARVSRSGTAQRSADDVEVVSGPVAVLGGQRLLMTIGGRAGLPQPATDGALAGGVNAGQPAAQRPGMVPPTMAPTAASAVAPMAAATAPGVAPMTASGTVVRVLVQLGPNVRVPPQTPVFVFARQRGGPPMPVAVRRLTVAELPALVTLDDTSAMVPGRNLSTISQVDVVARVARSGAVTPSPGDIEGQVGPVQPKSVREVLSIVVDQVRR